MSDLSCPCSSGWPLTECCGPILAGKPAPTTEALMRSRFTAYALDDVDHLVHSWHSSTCPPRRDLAATPGLRWIRLEVLGTSGGGLFDAEGTVEFRAHYREGQRAGAMQEHSSFAKEGGRWVYLGPVGS